MKKSKIIWGIIIFVLIILGTYIYSKTLAITSFEECVKAGNGVMLSYPAQCRTLDGRVFEGQTSGPMPCVFDPRQPGC